MRRSHFLYNHDGFTLIEVMTVFVVIGLFVSIAWPSYQNVVERARLNVLLFKIEELHKKCQFFSLENGTCSMSFSTRSEQPFVILKEYPGSAQILEKQILDETFKVVSPEFQDPELHFENGFVVSRGSEDFSLDTYKSIVLENQGGMIAKSNGKTFKPHTVKVDTPYGKPVGCIVTYNTNGAHFRGDSLHECPDDPGPVPMQDIKF